MPRVRYIYPTKVKRVERKSRLIKSYKDTNDNVIEEREDLGWFVITEAHDSFGVGPDKPELEPGEEIRVILEIPIKEAPTCPPSPHTNPQASSNSSLSETPVPVRPEV